VAIKRHEFHPQSYVALATPVSEADRRLASASVSPSLLAPVRGTTARSAVAAFCAAVRSSILSAFDVRSRVRRSPMAASRIRKGVAVTLTATSAHDKIRVLPARLGRVTRFACSATPAAAAWQTPRYVCLLEAA